MIYIFDLDDTLYDERQYVQSGLRAVAELMSDKWNIDRELANQQLIALLDKNGRGRIFNDVLALHRIPPTQKNVSTCVTTYRFHKPILKMPTQHVTVLASLPKPLYLVTDGHKIVQAKKVDALGIKTWFKKVFITHRYGVKNAKPSTYCFEKIRTAEKCNWKDMVYIGDNPAKDFVNLNKLGMQTVRVLTGAHKEVIAKPEYNATFTINTLSELISLNL